MSQTKRMIVGVSGATGVVYATALLSLLRELKIESHLVVSKAGEMTREYETSISSKELKSMADFSYPISDVGAAISSGSFKTMGMIVAPCSIRTLSEIATGCTGNLLSRAADVVLKERRKLVLFVRETPLHAGHLKSMLAVTEMGGIIAPPVPAFYIQPKNLEEIVEHTVCRALDLFDIENLPIRRWGEELSIKKSAEISILNSTSTGASL